MEFSDRDVTTLYMYIYLSIYLSICFRQYILTQMCDTTSKQNLETIVEAIRHLEGDHLFSEESGPHQVNIWTWSFVRI